MVSQNKTVTMVHVYNHFCEVLVIGKAINIRRLRLIGDLDVLLG